MIAQADFSHAEDEHRTHGADEELDIRETLAIHLPDPKDFDDENFDDFDDEFDDEFEEEVGDEYGFEIAEGMDEPVA